MSEGKNGKQNVTERVRSGLVRMSIARSMVQTGYMSQVLKGHPITGDIHDESYFKWVGGPGPERDQVDGYFNAVDNMLAVLGVVSPFFPYVANVGVWTLADGEKVLQTMIVPEPRQGTNGRVGVFLFMGIFEDFLLEESFPHALLMAEALSHTWGKKVVRWDTATTKAAVESLDLYNYKIHKDGIAL